MQSEEKTLEIFLNNMSSYMGKQSYRIVELETIIEARDKEIARLREELEGKSK